MREAQAKSNNARILYDAGAADYAQDDWFDPTRLAARGWLRGSALGRGQVHLFHYRGSDYVLRHYRRGGRVAACLGDRYVWIGLNRTRAWREWRMLARMAELGLPVPRPFAARVIKSAWIYRADLATVQLPASSSLADRLAAGVVPEKTWCEIGRVIRKFHDAQVWHADLNAHNVMLNGEIRIALIDFDRARFRGAGARWRAANLARLLRSLRKLKRLKPNLNFHEFDFETLREGYHSPSGV